MVASLAVADVTRSMAYCLPAVFVGVAALASSEGMQQIEQLAAIGAAISLLVPTYYLEGNAGLWWLYPLPVQIVRWLLP
jgi:dihydrodipicolinate synthase/N-acetylneuraminate lyase